MLKIPRTIVLVGLMGAGKTCIGREMAQRLGLEFIDADAEIEEAAGCSIPDIFTIYGEQAFRDGERRVIQRLLDGPVHVLATGGGAFMDAETRASIRDRAISVWLRAELDLLVHRVGRRPSRPLLSGRDVRKALQELMAVRYPVYGEADIIVDTGKEPPGTTVAKVMAALETYLSASETEDMPT